MTAPVKRRTIKVSPEVHAAIYRVASKAEGLSADEALQRLFASVHLHLSDVQRARWQAYADAAGLDLAEWVILRIERAICKGSLHRVQRPESRPEEESSS